ncbi:MAG: hypothetical protein KME06_04740 [Kastovskya adunca ATA6-11-RM4]|jgi:hypothetical protein|nr:hypothetical protein [Kastovskya adunca ATA6-11-RM4]
MPRQSACRQKPTLAHSFPSSAIAGAVSWGAIASLQTGLLTLAIPSGAAHAANSFQRCASELVRLAQIAPEIAANACADALNPQDLSRCVTRISVLTATLAPEALVACSQVRRPVELGTCVYNINRTLEPSEAIAVLNYCRRSLLPARFSECVIGLSREVDFSPPRAMDTCIAAESLPRRLFPSAAPPGSSPAVPSPIPFTPITPEN